MDPFIPIQTQTPNIATRFLSYIGLLFKLPLFLLFTLEIIILNDLFFRPLQSLNLGMALHKFLRIFILLHNYLFGRLILLSLGYIKYKSLFSSDSSECKVQNLQSHVFYCSRSSPMDVFVLITYFSPSFTHISFKNDKQSIAKVISYFRVITDSFFMTKCGFKDFTDGKEIPSLMEEIRVHRNGPLIIFWEGGITNGYNLLTIDPILQKTMENINSISKKKTNLTYTHRNPQMMISIQHDDRMNLIGNGPFQMLIQLLTHSFCSMDMFAFKPPQYSTNSYLTEIKAFIESKMNRGVSNQSWKDYQKILRK